MSEPLVDAPRDGVETRDATLPVAGIERARRLVELEPARPWTLVTLAREAGMSRTVFAERFAAEVGRPPGHFVAECRMREAARLLEEGERSLKAIAMDVGYRSRSAFSHAYRRWAGRPPATDRAARRARVTPGSGDAGDGSALRLRPGPTDD